MAPGVAAGQVAPGGSLSVVGPDSVVPFWSAVAAPGRWAAEHAAVAAAVAWEPVAPGVELGHLRLAGGEGLAWRLRLVLVRLDPRRVSFDLVRERRDGRPRGAWTVDGAPAEVRTAVNAGQFRGARPWGWVVREGTQLQPPERAPLAMAFVVDRDGRARLVQDDEMVGVLARNDVVTAFQSYPAVLVDDGRVPDALLAAGRGVDLAHRDIRLGLGELRDGRLLIALTRFDALDGRLSALPFGPTTPEMTAVLGALGARRGVLLDGGLSAQLTVVDEAGARRTWPGMRRVPMGLLVRGR